MSAPSPTRHRSASAPVERVGRTGSTRPWRGLVPPAAAAGPPAKLREITGLILDEPLILVGLAVVAAIVGVSVAIIRHRRLRPANRFRRLVAERDEIAVLLHPNPDPDSMASALAVSEIAADVDTATTLQYPGQVRHEENRVFQNVLEVEMERVEDRGDLACPNVVLVDHNQPRGFVGAGGLQPIAVIDHHEGAGRGTAFTDVRTGYGACATILVEYFRSLGYEADPEAPRSIPPRVATGLLYGILTDTGQYTKGATEPDFAAGSFLCDAVDDESLDRIANPQVDAEVLEVKARAVLERDSRGPFVVSDVGSVNNVDAIPQAADELLRLEGTTSVVVFGHRDGTLHISGRTRDDRVHVGRAIRTAVDEVPMSEGGGHARMGGGQVSLNHLEGIGPGEGLSRQGLRDRLFETLSGDV